MPNLIQEAKQQIHELLTASYEACAATGELPAGAVLNGTVEIPREAANGDFAANHAMTGARALHMAPKMIAEKLASHIELKNSWFESVEPAGPGRKSCHPSIVWDQRTGVRIRRLQANR